MDPLADAAVSAIYRGASGQALPMGEINRLLGEIAANGDVVPRALPEAVRALFCSDAQVGTEKGGWDTKRLRLGSAFFDHYGLQIGPLLYLVALPHCYAASKGVKVLCFTERIEMYTLRRTLETAQMVVDAMDEDGLGPQGRGRVAAQKVRLLHAAIRRLILDSGRWNPEWGAPINQEDMLGTLIAFTVSAVEGLKLLGLSPPQDEIEAYVYRWNVFGQLLGIRPELLPADYRQAQAVGALITQRHWHSSPEGIRLTGALLRMLQEVVPGTVFDSLIPAMMRHLLGEQVANLLGVKCNTTVLDFFSTATRFFRLTDRVASRDDVIRKLFDKLANAVLTGMLFYFRGNDSPGFDLPESLAYKWNYKPPFNLSLFRS